MQRQRDELVPVAEVIADLPGPVQALRKTPPRPRTRVRVMGRHLAVRISRGPRIARPQLA